jgi:fatty-acyl-CoA synthase
MSNDTIKKPSPFADLAAVEAFEQVPLSERDIPKTTYEALQTGAQIDPDSTALSFFLRVANFKDPFVWSYRELFADITRAANAFRRLGIEREDVIAYVLPNLPDTHFVIWGGEAAGIVFAINPLLEANQIAELLNAAKAKWLVTLAPTPKVDLWQKATAAAASVPSLQGLITVSLAPYLRGAAGIAFKALTVLKPPKAPELNLPVLNLRTEMANENGQQLDFDVAKPTDISSCFCTGGTTGLPKIAMRTQFSEVFDVWTARTFMEKGLPHGKAIFCGLPLFHVNGQLATGLGPWMIGDHVVLGTPQGYRAEVMLENFWSIIEHYRLYSFSGVPTLYSSLLQYPVDGHDVSSIEYCLCGAAPMPVELFRTFEQETGVRILEGYGLTEGACVSSINPLPAEPRIGSIGIRLPYQQMRAVIVDDNGRFERFAETDEIGAIAISGPNVFAGYVSEVHNQGVWLDIDGQRWLNTGDLGRQDSDGYFWLTGRKKEMIIRGGHNIDPKSIEEAIQAHPLVAMTAAIGRPDPHAGEVPVVYVQLTDTNAISDTELLDYAKQKVAERAAHPKAIHIVDELPVTPVGKIFKPALTMLEIESVVRVEASSAGVEIVSLEVVQDSQRGLLARVSTADGDATLRQAIGKYTFHTEFF